MALPAVFETFARQRAWPVMVRAVLERAFCDDVLDRVFKSFAKRQQARKLLF